MKKRAEKWFDEFQRSSVAWTSILGVLQNQSCPTEARHLCSIGLRNKCLLDLEELPKEHVSQVRESIISLLLAPQPLSTPIRTQLCLAFSGIAAHTPASDWNGIGMVQWLEQRLAGEQMPLSVIRMIEVLCIVAEEFGSYKPAVHPNRRREYCRELESYAPKTFQLLVFAEKRAEVVQDPKSLKTLLQAFSSWLSFAGTEKLLASASMGANQGAPQGASLQGLKSHPLIVLAFGCLQSSDMEVFGMAVDVMCALVECTLMDSYSLDIIPESSELVQFLVSSALTLRPKVSQYVADALAGKDVFESEDTVKSIARFLSEIADSYILYVAKGELETQNILEAMLDVAGHPDNDVSSMSYAFWYRLSKILFVGTDPDTEASIFPNGAPQNLVNLFKPAFSKLVCHMVRQATFAEDVDTWSKSEHRDFKSTRNSVGDIISDAKLVLGPEATMQLILGPLQAHHVECSSGKPFDWRVVEAAYYCAKTLARSMPFESALVHNLLTAIPTLPWHAQLGHTSCATVGAYSSWIAGGMKKGTLPDASLLTSLLAFVSSALKDGQARRGAAVAFKHICDSCSGILGAFKEQVFSIYSGVVTGSLGSFESEDVIEVLEGTIFVAMAMSGEEKQAALQMIVQPVLTPLQAMLNGSTPASEAQALRLLEQLEGVYKNVNDKQMVMQLLDFTSPIFDRALEVLGANVECAEKVCGALKYGLKTTGKHTAQHLLQHLFTNIPLRFSRFSHPCMLYLSSELVKIFGGQAESHGWLQTLVSGLVAEAHKKLGEIKSFDSRPDIVDDLFLLAGRVLSYAPKILFPGNLQGGPQTLQSLFSCAIAGMFVHHRDALISIYSFFYRLLTCGAKELETLMVEGGPVLVRRVMAGIAGAVPKAYLQDLGECLWNAVLLGNKIQARSTLPVAGKLGTSWLYQCLETIPVGVLTNQEKQSFITAVDTSLDGKSMSMRELNKHVKELANICRRNDKATEAAQACLLGH